MIADYTGSGAMGGRLGTPRTVRASFQSDEKLATTDTGRVVSVTSRIVIRPEAGPVRAESKISFLGEDYRVIQAYPVPDARRPSQWELIVSLWSAPS